MRAIALSYGFKEGISVFPKGTNSLGKSQNHLATPVCSSFLLKMQMRENKIDLLFF